MHRPEHHEWLGVGGYSTTTTVTVAEREITWRGALCTVAIPFILSRVLFVALTIGSGWLHQVLHLPLGQPNDPWHEAARLTGGTPLDLWLRWDAYWYLHIAAHGYTFTPNQHSSVAFFPLYPLLVHLLTLSFSSRALLPTGMLLSNVATLGGLAALYRLVARTGGSPWATRTVLVVCAFPTAFFSAAAYSEGSFLLLTALFFHDVQQNRWGRAALWSAAATLCRPLGVMLGPCYLLALYYAEFSPRDGHSVGITLRRSTFWRIAGAAAPLAGLAAYMADLGWTTGHALAFTAGQATWHRTWAWPWTALIEGLRRPLSHWPALSPTDWHAMSDLLITVMLLAVSLEGWRVLRREQALFLALFWLMTLSLPESLDNYPAPLSSLPRFLATCVPLYVILGQRPWLTRVTMLIGIPWLALNVVLFTSGAWVA